DLVARCLAKDRRDRYPDVGALREALEDALHEVAVPTRPPPAAPSSERPVDALRAQPIGKAPARGDRRAVGLLFFETIADVVTVQARLAPLGGQLAHAAGSRYVAAFGQESGANPARRALRAAEELLRQGLTTRVRLDLAPVAVQTRKDGSKRFVS